MLLIITDSNGNQQTIVVQSQGATQAQSGSIDETGVSQLLLSDENANRAGIYFQNQGENPMAINDIALANLDNGSSFYIPPGGTWPPAGYPVSTGFVNIVGTSGDKFFCREWSTLPPDDTE